MSISYLQSILPLPPTIEAPKDDLSSTGTKESSDNAFESLPEGTFETLSDQQLGVAMARFDRFRDSISPLRAKLDPIDAFLNSFHSEIKQLSHTLRSLEQTSTRLSSGADSSRDVVDKLNSVILDMMISPQLAESIMNDPIDESWLENIRFIADKQQLIDKINQDSLPSHAAYKNSKPFQQLQDGILLLEAKAIERIRDHLIHEIRLMRGSIKTSSQVVQEKLLQVKEIYSFLEDRHPQLAKQLQLAYIYTMKWYYTTRFAKYLHSLQKLRLKVIDSSFVLGASNDHTEAKSGLFGFVDASLRDSQSLSPSSASGKISLAEYFSSYIKRMEILAESNKSESRRSIPSQIAETTPFAYWMEFAFNQWSNALLDNIIVEYLFVVDFFYRGNEKFHPMVELDPKLEDHNSKKKDWSHFMFEDVYKMGQSFVSWLITSSQASLSSRLTAAPSIASTYANGTSSQSSSCDIYAILIMIRLIQTHSFALHNEFRVPVMEEYHNMMLLMLWPHFTRIIDINCEAMKKNILGSSTYSYRSLQTSQAPINATQQFSQLMVGLLKLAFIHESQGENLAQYQGEPVCSSIIRLRNDFESALTKTGSHVFGSGKNKAVQKEIFLFNNYFLVVTILRNEFDMNTCNQFIKEQIEHFELLCDAYKPKR
ncbi:hypothetical protein CLUG_03463 [Clavispora lusitaniae ATCC 42720]|uniref:Uncharacterized protein n=1 Tax=Clavispora lusitaniae (strain ATCC 42720) TaxID=306902 RepID=C4Y5M9_CLAL4|nr:uncharacterized protein CLUG_03463 [Clavispora lusitaniae ATCC 42720]EEQ39335.1 hypothetical protein CLUG_03463 [Clavispora lusitaniae ATCC 42720]